MNLDDFLRQPDITVVPAFCAAMAVLEYDAEILNSDPEAIVFELNRVVSGIPEDNIARVLAGVTLLTTDLVYKNLGVFIRFCNLSASDEIAAADMFDPADEFEVAFGRFEMDLLDTDDTESLVDNRSEFMRKSFQPKTIKMQFSEEILKYCGGVLSIAGAIRVVPSIPDAKFPRVIDFSDSPEMYAVAESRHRQIELDIADFVYERAIRTLTLLTKIPGADRRPVIEPDLGNQILAAIKPDHSDVTSI